MRNCGEHDFELFRISRGEWAPLLSSRIHVMACPACRARVSELRSVSTRLEIELATGGERKAFRRLSTPLAAAIILGGLIAFASLASQAGIVTVGQVSPAPAALNAAHSEDCATDAAELNKARIPLAKPLKCEGEESLRKPHLQAKIRYK